MSGGPEGNSLLNFARQGAKEVKFMSRKILRSPFKNSALCCFFTAFESHYIPIAKQKSHPIGWDFNFGWGAGIRTPVMSESESDALPLGDTPIFSTLLLYHSFFALSSDLQIFLNIFAFFAKIGYFILHLLLFTLVKYCCIIASQTYNCWKLNYSVL